MISLESPPWSRDLGTDVEDMGLLVSAHADPRMETKSDRGEDREQEVLMQVRVSGIRVEVEARLQRPKMKGRRSASGFEQEMMENGDCSHDIQLSRELGLLVHCWLFPVMQFLQQEGSCWIDWAYTVVFRERTAMATNET